MEEVIEIYVEIKRETELAYLCSDGLNEFWLPKSQIDVEWDSDNAHATVSVPEWLAIAKEII